MPGILKQQEIVNRGEIAISIIAGIYRRRRDDRAARVIQNFFRERRG